MRIRIGTVGMMGDEANLAKLSSILEQSYLLYDVKAPLSIVIGACGVRADGLGGYVDYLEVKQAYWPPLILSKPSESKERLDFILTERRDVKYSDFLWSIVLDLAATNKMLFGKQIYKHKLFMVNPIKHKL